MCTTSPTAFEVIDSSDLRTDDASAMGCLYAQGMHGAVVTCAVVRGLWQLAGERVARRRWV